MLEGTYKYSYKADENLLTSLSVYNVGHQKAGLPVGAWSAEPLLYPPYYLGKRVLQREWQHQQAGGGRYLYPVSEYGGQILCGP